MSIQIPIESVSKLEQHIRHVMETDPDNVIFEPLIVDGYIELTNKEYKEFLKDQETIGNDDPDFLSDWLLSKWNTEWNPNIDLN